MRSKFSSRLIVFVMFAMTGLPLTFAWGMVFTDWKPTAFTAKGDFLQNPVAWKSITTDPLMGVEGTWRLMIFEKECEQDCLARLESYRRMHVALGRQSKGLSRVLVTQDDVLNGDQFLYQTNAKNINSESFVDMNHKAWLVDPEGWLVMSFEAEQNAADLHKDILKLLKNNFQG